MPFQLGDDRAPDSGEIGGSASIGLLAQVVEFRFQAGGAGDRVHHLVGGAFGAGFCVFAALPQRGGFEGGGGRSGGGGSRGGGWDSKKTDLDDEIPF